MKSASKPAPSVSKTGLTLDPADPADAKIIARQRKASREMGRLGRERPDRDDLQSAYDEGAAEASATGGTQGGGGTPRGPGWSAFTPRSITRKPTMQTAGGFLTGLALYTVVTIYIRYGPEGWTGWLKAKFLNQPIANGATGAMGSKPKHAKGGTRAV